MLVAITHSTQENPVTGVPGIQYEEQLTEPIAEHAAAVLRSYGVTVRTDAPHTKAGDVARWADKIGADVLVDIHTDAATGKARGTSAFWYSKSPRGERLARALYEHVGAVGGIRRAAYARDDLIVLYGTKAVAALVELEFHDRADTATFVRSHSAEYGTAVAYAVLDYLGIPITTPPVKAAQSAPTKETPVTDDQIARLLDTPIKPEWGTNGTVRAALVAMLDLRDVMIGGKAVRLDEAVGRLTMGVEALVAEVQPKGETL